MNRAKPIAFPSRYPCECGLCFIISRKNAGQITIEVHHSKVHIPGAVRDFAREDCYTILGISPSATWEEIKRAYRARVSEYHPDKLAQEIRDYADNITKWINLAFGQIKRQRGLS